MLPNFLLVPKLILILFKKQLVFLDEADPISKAIFEAVFVEVGHPFDHEFLQLFELCFLFHLLVVT